LPFSFGRTDPSAAYDAFAAGVAVWNLFGLPALIATVLLWRAVWGRGPATRALVVRRVGLTLLLLAAWSLVRVVEEAWRSRTMGILPSNPLTGLPGSVVMLACDLPAGLGLLFLRRWAGRLGVVVAAIRVLTGVAVVTWAVQFGATYDVSEWPAQTALRVVPLATLFTLLLPRTRALFHDSDPPEPVPPTTPASDTTLALVWLALMVVTLSVAVTDALDFGLRLGLGLG
jgi:hypothetical protein